MSHMPPIFGLVVGVACLASGLAAAVVFGPRPWHTQQKMVVRSLLAGGSVVADVLLLLVALDSALLASAVRQNNASVLKSWLEAMLSFLIPLGLITAVGGYLRIRII